MVQRDSVPGANSGGTPEKAIKYPKIEAAPVLSPNARSRPAFLIECNGAGGKGLMNEYKTSANRGGGSIYHLCALCCASRKINNALSVERCRFVGLVFEPQPRVSE